MKIGQCNCIVAVVVDVVDIERTHLRSSITIESNIREHQQDPPLGNSYLRHDANCNDDDEASFGCCCCNECTIRIKADYKNWTRDSCRNGFASAAAVIQ